MTRTTTTTNGRAPAHDVNDRLRSGTLPTDPAELLAGAPMTVPAGEDDDGPDVTSLPAWPAHVLPPLTRRCVEAFAASTGAALELAAQPALAVAAAALGPGWRVGPPQMTRPAAAWLAVVAPPGAAKSPTADPILAPLLAADVRLREVYDLEHGEWSRRQRQRAEARRQRGHGTTAPTDGRRDDEDREPERRRLLVTDATPEALALELSRAEGHGLLLHADELASMLEGMDAYSAKGGRRGRAHYLSMWSGGAVRVSRRSSAAVEVDRPYLVACGGVQPSVLSRLELEDGDGLCARFLWALAPTRPHGLGRAVPLDVATTWAELLAALMRAGEGEPQDLEPAALERLDAHVRTSTTRAAELEAAGLGLLAALNGKASDYLVRLACLLHALDAAEAAEAGEGLQRGPVPLRTIKRAEELTAYYLAHGAHVARLVLRRGEAKAEGAAMGEVDEVARGLAALVPVGEALTDSAAGWVTRLASVGVAVEGRGDRGQASALGKTLRRLAALDAGPVRVRQPSRGCGARGQGRAWEVSHPEHAA